MPNQTIDQREVIRNYEVGQKLTRSELQSAATHFINTKKNSPDEVELLNAYLTGNYRQIDHVAHEGTMLKIRMVLSMKAFDDRMAAEFGEDWYGAEDYSEAVNRILKLPDGQERLTRLVDENRFDPFFRLGLSTISRMGNQAKETEDRLGYHALLMQEDRITRKAVEDTMAPISEQNANVIRQTVKWSPEESSRLLEQNAEQQLALAKFFLMMQLGGIRQRNERGGAQLTGTTTMAEIIAHGGRVVVTLPTGNKEIQDQMLDSAVGENRGNAAGMRKRTAATHDVKRKEVATDGSIIKVSHETAPKTGTWSNNYGMNFAGGGMGNYAIGTGFHISNDGTAGHCYVRTIPGDETHCGQMLIGFETSEPGKPNLYGLIHDWRAKSAPQSSFLADKTTTGIKHDGREVDLSNLSPESFASIMNRFEQRYRELQKRGDVEKLKSFNTFLTGRMANTSDLMGFLSDELGFSQESAQWLATEARYALTAPQSNIANINKYILSDEEMALDPSMNRVCAEERVEIPEGSMDSNLALASAAKRGEMARQMKDLRTGKFGINSGSYRNLLKAAEDLQNDMDRLANENLSPQDKAALLSRIEKETETMRKLAESYVQTRGKGEPHPNFSSNWGEKRFYAARSLMHLAEKMQSDLTIAREKLRPARAEAPVEQGIDSGRIANAHEIQPEVIRDTNLNEIAQKNGVAMEQSHEDFGKKRQEINPVPQESAPEHGKLP